MSIVNAAEQSAHPAHLDTSTGLDSRKMAFWTFIGSESLIFGSLIATYLAYKGSSIAGPLPHAGLLQTGGEAEGILDIPLTSISTAVLLFSSLAMVLGLAAVQRGDRGRSILWLLVTAVMGSIFLGFQAYEFTTFVHEGLTLQTNLFGSTFFVLTGFHGAHVALGVILLLSMATLAARDQLPPSRSLTVELIGLYWHFVDVIWIVIFALVYLVK